MRDSWVIRGPFYSTASLSFQKASDELSNDSHFIGDDDDDETFATKKARRQSFGEQAMSAMWGVVNGDKKRKESRTNLSNRGSTSSQMSINKRGSTTSVHSILAQRRKGSASSVKNSRPSVDNWRNLIRASKGSNGGHDRDKSILDSPAFRKRAGSIAELAQALCDL